MKTVAFSFLGTNLDAGKGRERWNRWRPNIALCQQDDLIIDQLELIHDRRYANLAKLVEEDIKGTSPETEVTHHVINFSNPWDFEEVYGRLRDLTDAYHFDPSSTTYLANLTTGTHVAQICWFLLTEARYFPGRLIQLSPSRKRDIDIRGEYQIIDLDLSKYDQIASRFEAERESGTAFLKSGIVTKNCTFNDMIEQMEKVAIRSQSPLLLLGPTGAGKSNLAKRLYELKKSRHQVTGKYVEVSCASLRGENARSALFGHKRGAFAGAVANRDGLLMSADKGVLFLDEIGELGLDEQAMILRAIEEGTFFPLGSDKEAKSDFQLIAGSNTDLRAASRAGKFRHDLLTRLDIWTYNLPGLSDRREDLAANIEYELARSANIEGQRVTFNKEAFDTYLRFAMSAEAVWAGNFRDLSASIMRMATLSDSGRIRVSTVEAEIRRLANAWATDDQISDSRIVKYLGLDAAQNIDPFDKAQLESVIEVCERSSSLSAAGRELFAISRVKKSSTNDSDRLKKYLAKWELSWTDISVN